MKALVVKTAAQLAWADIAPPELGPYDALVRIDCCGICNSTDTKLIDGRMFWSPPFPFVLGHESTGTVVELGSKVRKFRVGDRVTRALAFWPGERKELHVAMGGFAEFGVVRDGAAMAVDGDRALAEDYNVLRQQVINPALSATEAALSISLAETASVLRSFPNLRGQKIAVLGTGIAGYAFMLWCKLAGAHVIAVGRRDERLAQSKSLFGADATVNSQKGNVAADLRDAAHGPLDGILEATGDAPLADQALSALREDGIAVAYGVPPTGTTYASRWQNATVEEQLELDWVSDMILHGRVKPEWFISHVWKADGLIEAFAEVRRGEVTKGFVDFSELAKSV